MLMDPLWIMLIGMAMVVGSILWLRLHAFLALLIGALVVAALTPSAAVMDWALGHEMSQEAASQLAGQGWGERVAAALGETAGEIAILIALAAVIGRCLLDSGAAERIVRSFLKALGQEKAPAAFLCSGFVLGVPVYFDTVFYLLMPLGKSMGLRQPAKYGLLVMSIIAGTTMAHSLVPPTPGPLFVAAQLEVDLALMIGGGLMIGVVTCAVGYAYALWANRKWPVPLRESAGLTLEDLEAQSKKPSTELPSFWLSIFPIVLPVVLIAGRSLARGIWETMPQGFQWLEIAGDKNIALLMGAMVAMGMLVKRWSGDRERLKEALQNALSGAGVIILITSAGGAFGEMLQQTGIADRITSLASSYQVGLLPLAFLVTALVRTAQGSATVAMITTVGLLAGMVDPASLDYHPVYVALAIGCGSKPFPWMNDSGFWIISRMSGMTERETFKAFSWMITLMGLAGLVAVMILSKLFPFMAG